LIVGQSAKGGFLVRCGEWTASVAIVHDDFGWVSSATYYAISSGAPFVSQILFFLFKFLFCSTTVPFEESFSQLTHRKFKLPTLRCGESPRRYRVCPHPPLGNQPPLSTVVVGEGSEISLLGFFSFQLHLKPLWCSILTPSGRRKHGHAKIRAHPVFG
jgi:hypothetical protein